MVKELRDDDYPLLVPAGTLAHFLPRCPPS